MFTQGNKYIHTKQGSCSHEAANMFTCTFKYCLAFEQFVFVQCGQVLSAIKYN